MSVILTEFVMASWRPDGYADGDEDGNVSKIAKSYTKR